MKIEIALAVFLGVILGQASLLAQDTLFVYDSVHLAEIQIIGNHHSQNPQALQEHQLSSVDETMSKLPMVVLIKRGGYAQEPTIRTYSAGQISVTIDGMKMFGACTDKMDPISSYVETGNMKSITIDNAQNSLFGTNIGGAMNFQLNKASFSPKKKFKGDLATGFSSASLGTDNSLRLEYSMPKIAFNMNGSYRKHENYRASTNEEIAFTQYAKFNTYANLRIKSGDKSTLSFDVIFDNASNVGYNALPMDVSKAQALILAGTYTYFPQSAIKKIEAKAYFNSIEHIMDDTKRPFVPMHMDMPGWSTTYGYFIHAKGQMGKHSFNLKQDNYLNIARAEMVMYPNNAESPPMYMETWPEVLRNVSGIAFTDAYKSELLGELRTSYRTDFLLSQLRSDFGREQLSVFGYNDEHNRTLFAHNISIGKDITIKKQKISASLNYSERAPTLTEMYGFYLFNAFDGYDYIGMPDIKKERSVQAETEISFAKGSLNAKWNLYAHRIYNYIQGVSLDEYQQMTIGAYGVKKFENIQYANIVGGSIELYQSYNKFNWYTQINYTAGSNYRGDYLPLIPPLNGILKAKYNYKQYSLSPELKYSFAQNNISTIAGEDKTEGFGIANVFLEYVLPIKENKIMVTIGIENILDKFYYEHLDWRNTPRAGRNFKMQVNFKF